MPSVSFSRDGDVGLITLSNGDLNLFGEDSFHALDECVAEVESSDVRAAVWRAEGDVFSAGVDVQVFKDAADAGEGFPSLVGPIKRLEALPIPTLAICQGLCLTAGLEVALGCDMIWAGESAKFGLVERVVGLTPGAGGTQRIAERAGPARAREFVMTGRLYDAQTMERWNVINRVVADADLAEKGMAFARELASGPTVAHGMTKRIVRAFLDGGIDRADEVTPGVFADLFATEDLQRAVESFLREGPGKATFEGK
ncbi:enoyl-CoA hydratase/isomerase family protein [soil metagenome]